MIALRTADPMLFDALTGYAADALRRAVPGKARRYMSVAGKLSKSRASRHLNGDPHSPATAWLVRFATSEYASAWPLIAEAIAVVMMMSIRKRPIEELRARLAELDEAEHDAECEENRSTVRIAAGATPEQLEVAARANVREAEISLERAGILRELARRARRSI